MQNPFGDAKPREKVIAERTGKDEKDILVEDSQEYRFKLRLNPEQRAEKSTFDDEVKALKDKLAEVADDEELTAEVQVRACAASIPLGRSACIWLRARRPWHE